MHDLNQAVEKSQAILDRLTIPYIHPVRFSTSTRMSRALGKCVRTKDGFEIRISRHLLDDENDETALITTLLHEHLHTIPDCFNHGPTWKYYAERVSMATGFPISRTVKPGEVGLVTKPKADKGVERYRYVLECQHCHHAIFRQKRSKAVDNPAAYACPLCGGPLKVYELTHH